MSLERLAEKFQLSLETIKGIYQEKLDLYRNLPSEKREKKALLATRNLLRRRLGRIRRLTTVRGYLVADAGISDIAEVLRRRALRAWSRDPREAISQGLTDDKGTPIFIDSKGRVRKLVLEDGKKVHWWRRTFFGVGKFEENNAYAGSFRLTISHPHHEIRDVPLWSLTRFKAIYRGQIPNTQYYQFNASRAYLSLYPTLTREPDITEEKFLGTYRDMVHFVGTLMPKISWRELEKVRRRPLPVAFKADVFIYYSTPANERDHIVLVDPELESEFQLHAFFDPKLLPELGEDDHILAVGTLSYSQRFKRTTCSLLGAYIIY